MSDDDKRPDTRLVQGGRRKPWLQGMVNVPVSRTSTVLFDSVSDLHAAYPPRDGTPSYGRNGTPTHWSLCEALSALEPGAAGTRLFPSGAAAVAMALLSVVSPGDELLMVDSCYQPTRRFCDTVLARSGIATRYYDPAATPAEVEALFTDRTRAIFLESPGSMTFEVQDVPGICARAASHGIVTLLDNTWATPLFFPALEHGVDLAILACTKYVSGHSDVMLGSVTAAPGRWPQLADTYVLYGQSVGADDAFLAARGLRTLGVRLRQHQSSALEVARWLEQRPEVGRVLHPALEACPGHQHWARDYRGASGLFAFELAGAGQAEAARLVDALELFGIGYSWGGFESLAVPFDPGRARSLPQPARAGAIVRLHVGLEDPRDLIADLERGLAAIS